MGTSAQKAKIIALTRAPVLAKGQRIDIWTDSRYAFGVVHVHAAIWKERGLLTSQNKEIEHAEEVLELLEVVLNPAEVAIMHCKGHFQGNTIPELGNAMADRTAKAAAATAQVKTLALILSNIHLSENPPPYDSEDLEWLQEEGGQIGLDGRAKLGDKLVITLKISKGLCPK